MPNTDYPGYVFGSVVYLSGLAGFLVNKNKVSLVIGSWFGGAAVWGAYDASCNPDEPILATINSGCLTGILLGRNIMANMKGHKPRGVSITILSLVMFGRYCKNMYMGLSTEPDTKFSGEGK